MTREMTLEQARDFGFFDGDWDIASRRLQAPLTGRGDHPDDWEETSGTARVRSHLGGAVSVDEISLGELGVYGVGLRIREAASATHPGEWSDRFVAARDGLFQPALWTRDGDVREQFGDEVYDGMQVEARYRWDLDDPDRLRWSQAYSTDGSTWETNWEMTLVRRPADQPAPPPDQTPGFTSATGDFDFLRGTFRVRSRRLLERLRGCTEWVAFEHVQHADTLLGGQVSLDDNDFPDIGFGAWSGFTFRLYDVAAAEWAIHWVDSRFPELGEAVRGRFVDGVGEFFSDEQWEGAPIRVRFRWHAAHPETGAPRWEQAFSLGWGVPDSDRVWETNWVSDYERVG